MVVGSRHTLVSQKSPHFMRRGNRLAKQLPGSRARTSCLDTSGCKHPCTHQPGNPLYGIRAQHSSGDIERPGWCSGTPFPDKWRQVTSRATAVHMRCSLEYDVDLKGAGVPSTVTQSLHHSPIPLTQTQSPGLRCLYFFCRGKLVSFGESFLYCCIHAGRTAFVLSVSLAADISWHSFPC